MTTEIAVAPRTKNRFRIDAVAMFVYLSVCHAWALNLRPLGKDFAILAGADSTVTPFLRLLVDAQVQCFGENPLGYRLVAFALLYACMLLVYGWVKRMHPGGPYWLGTLAATMFMAIPVHADGVFHLTSVTTLAPAFAALLALYLHATAALDGGRAKHALALAAFILASGFFPGTRGLALVIPMVEFFVLRPRWQDSLPRALSVALIGAAIWALQGFPLPALAVPLAQSISPLYFVFYPIGFLPEIAHLFHAHPWTGWAAFAAVAATILLILRAARRPLILFGLCAMVAYRFAGGVGPVDPVHLVGGGHLLVETALFCVTLTALFKRMMEHPKWKRFVVNGTSMLCLLYFALTIQAVSAWRLASASVAAFQAQAQAEASRTNAALLLVPDYRYYRGAPMALSEAISFDTPFSKPLEHLSLLRLHYDTEAAAALSVAQPARGEVSVAMDFKASRGLAVWPYALLNTGDSSVTGDVQASVRSATADRTEISIRYDESPGATLLIPFADAPPAPGVIP